MKYMVQAYWTKQCEGPVEVEAESEEEAREAAREAVLDDLEAWEYANWLVEDYGEWEVEVVDGH